VPAGALKLFPARESKHRTTGATPWPNRTTEVAVAHSHRIRFFEASANPISGITLSARAVPRILMMFIGIFRVFVVMTCV
jgi:hypothetical protein